MKTRILSFLVFLAVGCVSAMAQFQVKGTVVAADDSEPLVGATIMESGTQNGTTADLDGNFTLNLKSGKSAIVVSYVGFSTETVQVNNRKQLEIKLTRDDQSLDEVVVVGYGVQRKSDLTGAIASVSGEDLKGLATTDAAAALQGKAAGVQILNTSGAPGEGAQIRVRGYSSNSGNLGPLLIVDGLKVDNIQYLDPSMIKSMEVLKDAASAAIYGAEAGNGVILITTRAGDANDAMPRVVYSFKAINQRLGKTPEIFGAKDWINYKELQGFDMKTMCEQNGVDYNNPKETNWIKEVFEPSWSTQHSVTLQGGNDKGHFYTGINYVDNDGIVKGKKDTYSRLTAQLNADYQLYSWIKVGTNTSIERWQTRSIGQHQANNGSVMLPALTLDPLTPVYWDSVDDFTTDMKNQYDKAPNSIWIAPNGKYYATTKFAVDGNGNPLLQIARRDNKSSGFTVRGTGFLDLNPFKGFVFTSRFSYRIAQSNTHSYSTPYYMNGIAKTDNYEISANANNSYYYQWENFANYNNTFAKKHNVSAMVGMSFTQSKIDNVRASAQGTEPILNAEYSNFQFLDYVNSASTTAKTIGNLPSRSTSLSYFGRLMYTFDNRYSLQFNFRADAFDTSKLPKDKRWGKFPSVSAGWTVSNEKFFNENISQNVMSFLKIRGSWGRNGNINVLSGYPYTAPIAYNGAWYQYGDSYAPVYGSYMDGFANPDLHWEISEQLDLGIDMRFLNSRLTVGLDYYDKNTKDLLINVNTVPEVYHNTTTINAGRVNNRGFEAEVTWRDHFGDLNYSVSGNISTLRNRVSSLYDGIARFESTIGGVSGHTNKVRSAIEEGRSLWFFRAYDYVGVDRESGEPRFRNAEGEIVSSTELTENDMTDIGSSMPKLTYGITINLEYKGIDLTVFGTGVSGNKIFNLIYRPDTPMRNSLTYYLDNAWTPDNRGASMPAVDKVAHDDKFWSSSASMFDGSYFKIKQIQLGYTVPRNITRKAFIKNLRVFVSLDDFFTFTKYPGMDPETATAGTAASAGYDIGSYPTMKKVTFGATIGF